MIREKVRHFRRILGMRAHSPRQGPHSAQNQPAIKRRGDCAARILDRANTPEKIRRPFCDDDSAEHIAVAAKIFRGRMEDEIGAEIEWPLNDRRPGVIANTNAAGFVSDLCHGREIDNFQERIRRRFHPDQFRVWPQRFFHRRADRSCRRNPLPVSSAERHRAAIGSSRNKHRRARERDRRARALERNAIAAAMPLPNAAAPAPPSSALTPVLQRLAIRVIIARCT